MQNKTTILGGKSLFLILCVIIGLSLAFSCSLPPVLAADGDVRISSISVNETTNLTPNPAPITYNGRQDMNFSFGASLNGIGPGTYKITMSASGGQSTPATPISIPVQNSNISFGTLTLEASKTYSITYSLYWQDTNQPDQVVDQVTFILNTGSLDNIPPQVESSLPPAGVNDNILVYFNKEMDSSTISNSNVILRDANNTSIACNNFSPRNSGGKTILPLDPIDSLKYNNTYTISLSNLKDLAGNTLPAYTWSFTTPPDPVAPLTIVSSNPINNAQNVSVTGPFTLSFNRELDSTTVNSATVYVAAANGMQANVRLTCANVNGLGTITITPTSKLLYATGYSINVVKSGSNAVKDLSGRPMESTTLRFTTQMNQQLPTIISQYPAPAATSVDGSTTVYFQFNQDMNAATINSSNVYLRKNGGGYITATVSYNQLTRMVTITPLARLESRTSYYVYVSSAVQSMNGVSVTATNWYFTTSNLNTSNIIECDPIANASGVAVDKVIRFRFNSYMNSPSINSSTVYLSRAGSVVPASVSYDLYNNWVNITPSSHLSNYTEYVVNVSSGVKDSNLNSITATSWKFTTGYSLATGISERDPYENASGVALDKIIKFRFDTNMDAATINSNNIYLTRGGSKIYASVSYEWSTRRVTITPDSKLQAGTEYTVNLNSNIRDYNGNYISATSWRFTTTGSNSFVGISEQGPYNNASGVALDKTIKFRFDTNMNSSTINSSNIYLTRGGSRISASVSYDSSTRWVTITPDSKLQAGTEYTVNLTSSIRDYNGNYFSATSWKFTTTGSYSTGISERDPYENASGVALDKIIKFRFDTNMNSSTINSSNIYLTRGSSKVYARVSYDSSTRWVTITPDSKLQAGTEYTVNLSNNIRDNNDKYFSASSWKFTTKSTAASIRITAQEPAPAAANVSVKPVIKITFNTPLDLSCLSSSNFYLLNNNGASVECALNYDSSLYRVSLTPWRALLPGTNYTVCIGSGVKDSSGNTALAQNWSFRTTASAISVGRPGSPVIILDGQQINFTDVAPYIKNGRTLLPFRTILELLGAEVSWDQKQQKVTARLNGNTFDLIIGSKKAYRNGKVIGLDVAPEIKNGRTMIPIRFAAESLGVKTDWQASTYTIVFSR